MPFHSDLSSALLPANRPVLSKPFITGWNRLEGRVRTEEFERALRAEARDPLWFLARQWQFLELKADDAGSPIEARLATRHTRLERFATQSGPAGAFPRDTPLEAIVEREEAPFDRITLIQLHRAFDKALIAAGVANPTARQTAHDWMRSQYPIADVDGVDDVEARQLAVLTDAHLFDAKGFLNDANFAANADASLGASEPALLPAVKAAGEATAKWFRALYLAPDSISDIAWTRSQLEYQFQCATAPGESQTVLIGDSYTQGRLDWFCVDVAQPGERLDGGSEGEAPAEPLEQTLSFLPAMASFSGMPSHRFWEMEDRKVEFGALTAHTTDIGKLLLTEFMLSYANDWCVIPLEVDVGVLIDTLALVVHDVFGDATLIRAADRGADEEWRRWAMFGLENRGAEDRPQPRLFVPPTTPKLMESEPIERDIFLRDEMANLCWAVERTVLSAAGVGVDGEQYALSLETASDKPPPAPGATARYRLGTDVPRNWRPFMPVRKPGSERSIRLQRARLPLDDSLPFGAIIGGTEQYFVDEEAVPRAGVIVTRAFQRTRWNDGRVVLWVGRRAMVGRGEGSSGLAFDLIEEIPSRA
jgi:hypothetical protein